MRILLLIAMLLLVAMPAVAEDWPKGKGVPGEQFDDCRGGSRKGGGYDATTGRYAWTCGNYNWHTAEPDASYMVTCTGDGTPHTSCLGTEKRMIGALHRVGMAVDRTMDGGTVYLPNFVDEDYGIYVDDGCGTLSDGTTRAECPPFYDPDIEALSWYADSGHAWIRGIIRAERGITIEGEDRPGLINADTNTPTLKGVWLVDDRGADPTNGAPSLTLDGPSTNIQAPTHRFGTGWNGYLGFCSTTGNSITCQDQPTDKDWLGPPFSAYASATSLLTDPSYDSGSVDVCLNNAIASTGTCSLDRRYKATAVDAAVSAGGCNGAEQDLGDGQGFVDAMEADVSAGEELVLAFEISKCEDDPTSSSNCAGTATWVFADVKEFRNVSCSTGGELVRLGTINDGAGYIGRSIWPFQDIRYFAGGGTNVVYAVDASRVERDSGTLKHIGVMPANFHQRNSATSGADCLSGGDPDTADDEAACDSGPLIGLGGGYHGKLDGVTVAYGSVGNKSNLDGGPSCIECEVTNSYYTANRRGIWSDASSWYFHGNVWARNNLAATGTSRGFNVFSSGFRIDGDYFFANDVSQLVVVGASNNARRNQFTNLKIRQMFTQSSLFEILGGGGHLIENVDAQGISGAFLRMAIDSGRVVQGGMTIRNSRYVGRGVQGTTPDAVFEFTSSNLAGERTGPILIQGMDAEMSGNDSMLVYFENDENASGELDESRGQIQLVGNRMRNVNGDACLFAIGDRDQAGIETCASGSPAVTTAWGGPNHTITTSDPLPYVLANEVNGAAVPDFQYRATYAAEIPNCSSLPSGTVVAVVDDSGTCTDTTPADGALDGGSTTLNTCQCDGAGTWSDF